MALYQILLLSTAATALALGPIGHENYNPSPNASAVISYGNARFTVLTPSLIRMEAGPSADWPGDDRPTAVVVNRALPLPSFTVSNPNSSSIRISTSALTLTYIQSIVPAPVCSTIQQDTDVDSTCVPVLTLPNGTTTSTAASCCSLCGSDPTCMLWTFRTVPQPSGVNCWLYLNEGVPVPSPGVVRGQPPSLFSSSNLQVEIHTGGVNTTWSPGMIDDANLLGAFQKTECYNGSAACVEYFKSIRGPGVASRSGWALIDDTATLRFAPLVPPRRDNNTVVWWLDDAPLVDSTDWYLFAHGTAYTSAVADFAAISGPPAMPPRDAFGVAWSRWYPYNETSVVQEVLDGYAADGLPLNTLILDMDWHVEPRWDAQCNWWGGYDFNSTLFPTPEAFIDTVRSNASALGWPLRMGLNYHQSTGVDPCAERYAVMAALNGVDPSTNATVQCDFSNATYIFSLFDVYLNVTPLSLVDVGWMDWGGCAMQPLNPRGNAATFNSVQFITLWWGNYVPALLQMMRGLRPWNLYRWGGYGQQRYPAGFSGDTFAAWETLAWEIAAAPTSANVGFGYWSFDIGGYMCEEGENGCDFAPGNATSSELLLRWLQYGAVAPMFRTHCDHCERRIWLFMYSDLMKDALLLRNALSPYLYTEARAAYDSGVVAVHPLYYEHPTAAEVYDAAYVGQYMLGARVMAAPIASDSGGSGQVSVTVWIPPGTYVDWNGSAIITGPVVASNMYGLGDIPLFVPAGALIPMKTMTSVAASAPDPIVWNAWQPADSWRGAAGGGGDAYTMYEDDGISPAYTNAASSDTVTAWTAASIASVGGSTTFHVSAVHGTFPGIPATRTHQLLLRGAAAAPPASVCGTVSNGTNVCASHSVPGVVPGYWFASNQSLTAPLGSLVIDLGSITATQSMDVVVVW